MLRIGVLPALAGMSRVLGGFDSLIFRAPRASGDEPPNWSAYTFLNQCSPR